MPHYTYKDNVFDTIDDLLEMLSKDGVLVEKNDDWTTVNSVCHEPYDFNIFIKKAKEYSDKSPPDVIQFSEKAWGAAAICVKEFYLKNFGILVKSHSARSKMLMAICAGCKDVKESAFIAATWKEAEGSHSNFYEMKFLPKADREALLMSLEKMAAIIDKVDIRLVDEELNGLESVTLQTVPKTTFKIGSNSYSYGRIVF